MPQSTPFGETLDSVVSDLDMSPTAPAPAQRRGGRRTRGRARPERPAPTTKLRIIEQDDVLYVDDGRRKITSPSVRRGGSRAPAPKAAWEKDLTKLDRSQIGDWLIGLDEKLTPNQGLRTLDTDSLAWRGGATTPDAGRVLLFVHGTFSNGDSFLNGFRANPWGDHFIRWARENYDQVLSFDHPTLRVSPIINARDLARQFQGSSAHVDVVAHSRGGLITRWWLDAFHQGSPELRRAVLVGSPLAGTGLASPPRIRGALSLLANIANALGGGTAAVPFLSVMSGVFRVVASVTTLASRTPAVDAALALVPGLVAQSRVGDNAELLSMRDGVEAIDHRYFAVRSNFESEKVGWKFWKNFRERAKNKATDMVFRGDNDLVVDTGSMTQFGTEVDLFSGLRGNVHDFGTSSIVHHNNYFDQPATLKFIADKLRVGA